MGKLLDKFGMQSQGITPSGKERPTGAPKTVTAMQVHSSKLEERAEAAEAEVARLQEQLAAAKSQGGALEIHLDMLVEVEGRRRKLTPEAYAELRENLSQHELITPVTVRVLENGKYEIVSGHNRVAVYREIGRETIKAWPADADVSKTDELAFYANLLHPDLSAYEKYLGLKKVAESNPGLTTHEALAQRTGLSRQAVTELMSFDGLPLESHAALAKRPNAISAKAAVKLAALVEEGRAEQVTHAVEKAVAEKNIEQQEIVRIASAKPKAEATVSRPEPKTFRAGRRNYCSMIGAKKTLRLDFASEDEREEAEARVAALLEEMAEQKKAAK